MPSLALRPSAVALEPVTASITLATLICSVQPNCKRRRNRRAVGIAIGPLIENGLTIAITKVRAFLARTILLGFLNFFVFPLLKVST